MNDALELLKEFCRRYYVERNAEKASALLSSDIKWLIAPEGSFVNGIDEAERIMRSRFGDHPQSRRIEFFEEALTPVSDGCGVASLFIGITSNSGKRSYYWTAVTRKEEGTALICSLTTSRLLQNLVRGETGLHSRQAQIENLLNAIPGGVAEYVIKDGAPVLLFHTDKVAELTGRTNEEYERIVTEKGFDACDDDIPLIKNAIMNAAFGKNQIAQSYRAIHSDGSYIWIMANIMRLNSVDGLPTIHVVYTYISSSYQLYRALADDAGIGIIVKDSETYELYYTNEAARSLFGIDFYGNAVDTCFGYYNDTDKQCEYYTAVKYEKDSYTEQTVYSTKLGKYLRIKGMLIDWAGKSAIVEYIDDITVKTMLEQRLSDIIQSVPCGICLYRWDGKTLRPIIANKRFSEMIGDDAVNRLERVDDLHFKQVHPDDVDALRDASLEALAESDSIDYSFRMRNSKTGEYLWMRMRGVAVTDDDGTKLVYMSYNDVTKEHMTELRLRENESLLEYATSYAGLWYWRYDAQNDRAYFNKQKSAEYGLPEVIDNYLETWLSSGFVHTESAGVYRDAIERIRNGEEKVSFEARIYSGDGVLHWARFRFANVFDKSGKTSVTVCTSMIIDTEKQLQTRYELERKKPLLGGDDLLAYALFNLNTGDTIEYCYSDGSALPDNERAAFGCNDANVDLLIVGEEEKRLFRLYNDREYLLSKFEQGETEFKFDARKRQKDGSIIWIRNIHHLVRDPSTGDIMFFAYYYNADEEIINQQLYSSLAYMNCDYIVRVYVDSGRYVALPKNNGKGEAKPVYGDNSDELAMKIANSDVLQEDVAMTLSNTTLVGIKRNLATADSFRFTCRIKNGNGTIGYRKITMYWLDRLRGIIVVTHEDVTSVVHHEIKKNEMLSDALKAANNANNAKSEFLSHMSHDMRTPLNAIIALSDSDMLNGVDEASKDEYLEKIHVSGKFLLGIINDILDMSKIENKKMKLNLAPYSLQEFEHTIFTIIGELCKKKDIEFVFDDSEASVKTAMLDKVRFNQIFINLLSNAVKFTPYGGKIEFMIGLRVNDDGNRMRRFIVRDNGIGMSAEFIPHAFDSFSQEYREENNELSKGTGLGLSIVKELVSLMNGKITVTSELGKGTEFTVDLPIDETDADNEIDRIGHSERRFDGMRILVCEDNRVNMEIAAGLLKKKGCEVDCAYNGREGVDKYLAATVGTYNAILMDIRMPVMNGYEAVKAIRESGKADAENIPIIAMTADALNSDERLSKLNGMNAHVSKPVEPRLFYSTLAQLLPEKQTE